MNNLKILHSFVIYKVISKASFVSALVLLILIPIFVQILNFDNFVSFVCSKSENQSIDNRRSKPFPTDRKVRSTTGDQTAISSRLEAWLPVTCSLFVDRLISATWYHNGEILVSQTVCNWSWPLYFKINNGFIVFEERKFTFLCNTTHFFPSWRQKFRRRILLKYKHLRPQNSVLLVTK